MIHYNIDHKIKNLKFRISKSKILIRDITNTQIIETKFKFFVFIRMSPDLIPTIFYSGKQ